MNIFMKTNPLELVKVEQIQLTTLLIGSLTKFTVSRFFYDSTFTKKFKKTAS